MSDYGHEQTDKELKRVENLISKEYAQAAEELEKKMMKHFSDFSRKDAEKQKELKSGIITEQRYNEWKIGQLAIGQRWKDARDSMTDILVNADKNAAAIIQGNNIKAYGENMNYGTYEVEHGSEINTGFTLYDEETVRNLLKEDPKLIPMPKVDIPKDELWNRQKLTSAVTQGILQGESIDKIAKRLGQVADMDKNAAIRNARTYTTAAENKGRLDSYERAEKLGIKTNKKWIATLDDRTRVEHRHLDNMIVAYDEDFEVDGYTISYPGDPSAEPEMIYNCRCTLVAEIVNYDYKDERNDSKLGDMSYEEWKHAKDKPQKEEIKPEPDTKNKIEFIPAKNIDEAEEYAKQFADNVDYKGISIDKANAINEQLTILKDKYPTNKLDEISQKGGKQAASANYHRMTINKKNLGKTLENDFELFQKEQEQTRQAIEDIKSRYPSGKIPSSMQDQINRLENQLKYDRWSVLDSYDNKLEALITHEYGHIIADQYFAQINTSDRNLSIYQYSYKKQQWDDIYKKAVNNGDIYKMSKYGGTNSHEYFAECFCAREFGETIPDYAEDFIKELLNGEPL